MQDKKQRVQITASPLYGMRGKNEFRYTVGVHWDAVPALLTPSLFSVREKGKRLIQQPLGPLAKVHARLGTLLRQIETADYHHPRPGTSYVDHARLHAGTHALLKADLRLFFQSVTRGMVFRVFFHEMGCAADVADRLADLCCYRQRHLPLGSPLSGPLAALAARPLFDDIDRMARASGCVFTAYVDDIVVSGPNVDRDLLHRIHDAISRHGFRLRLQKSRLFEPTAAKLVTGVVVRGHSLRLPHDRYRAVHRAREALVRATAETAVAAERRLRGLEQTLRHDLRLTRDRLPQRAAEAASA